MKTVISLVMAVIPTIHLVKYFYRQDIARPEPKGSKLSAELNIDDTVVLFLAGWISFLFLFEIGTLYDVLTQSTNPLFLLIPLIMIGLCIGVAHFVFNSEKKISIILLKSILNVEE